MSGTREFVMEWRGKAADVLLDEKTRELDVEGAIRSGKTTVCIWREFNAYVKNPGMHGLLARWTDTGVWGLVVPIWRQICESAGVKLKWNPDEEYDELPNKSRAYIRGLKSQDQTLRYSKFRGLTLSRVYIDQAEEVPMDIYLELAGRLSQKGFQHQITISPQSVEEDHWIAKEFPVENDKPERRYIPLSVHDNAHNLDPSVIPALYRLYPPAHPKHKTLILGLRGMNVTGEPVYGGAFLRLLHEGRAEFDPALPLLVSIDFGKHHPCLVVRQDSSKGQRRYLGGVFGQEMYLGDFLNVAQKFLGEWFPNPVETIWCCDPAGAADTSHGTKGAVKILNERGITPRYIAGSNSPAVRLGVIERIADQMRRRAADGSEAVLVSDSERWVRVSSRATVIDRFVADAFQAGYVWDEHVVSVGNKPMRKPKKDGWYEHGMNCVEYLETNFGGFMRPKPAKKPVQNRRISAWS